jgi:hypothetical protein
VNTANADFSIKSACKRLPIAAFLLLAPAILANAHDVPAATASLNLLWAKPIEAATRTPSPSTVILWDVQRSPIEPVIALANDGRSQILLEASSTGTRSIKTLSKNEYKARVLRLARNGNTLWLGGLTHHRSWVPGGDMADRYLGKLDIRDNTIAEYSFSSSCWAYIDDLVPLPSGDVIVAGLDCGTAWLAQISHDGKILWERKFGLGKSVSVATLGDRIFAIAFDAVRKGGQSGYREDVRIWRLNGAGEILGSQLIREGINFSSGSTGGKVALEPSNDAVYAVSSYPNFRAAREIEVTKIGADGRAAWTKTLPKTMWHGWPCKGGKTVLTNGDLLIACAIENQILLFQLDAKSGEVTERSTPLPECNRNRPVALFLHRNSDGNLWLFGSRPVSSFSYPGCTWLGVLTLRN